MGDQLVAIFCCLPTVIIRLKGIPFDMRNNVYNLAMLLIHRKLFLFLVNVFKYIIYRLHNLVNYKQKLSDNRFRRPSTANIKVCN
jgi:hypothetical protein